MLLFYVYWPVRNCVCLYEYIYTVKQVDVDSSMCLSAGSRGISLTCVLTPCRVIGMCVTLMTLGAIGAAVWAVGQTIYTYNFGQTSNNHDQFVLKCSYFVMFTVKMIK